MPFIRHSIEHAARVAAANPGCAIVEVIGLDHDALLAIPITDVNRDLEIHGMPGLTIDLLAGATIWTAGAKR